MISNEERRECATRLRTRREEMKHEAPPENPIEAAAVYLLEISNTVKVGPDGQLMNRLADLIDRPICLMNLTETIETDKGKVRVWECDRCGQECEELNGDYEYCPHCGAKVVR